MRIAEFVLESHLKQGAGSCPVECFWYMTTGLNLVRRALAIGAVSNFLETLETSNILDGFGFPQSHVVYRGSFFGAGDVVLPSAGTPIGGNGGGIPRLFEMMIASARAILDTA